MTTPALRLLGPRAATQCAVRVQYDVLPPEGVVAAAFSETSQARMDEGLDFRDLLLGRLVTLNPHAVRVEQGPDAVAQTMAAIEDGVPIIVGPRLPADATGGRNGSPAVLLRHEGGYVPVLVRLHGTTAKDNKRSVLISTLEDPLVPHETLGLVWKPDRLKPNAFQLAHYWRLLEHHGLAAGNPRGAVLDRSERLVWLELDTATPTPDGPPPVTLLGEYDREFAHRTEVVAHTQARLDGSLAERIVLPLAVSECGGCPWNASCTAELTGQDHVSLLPGFRASWFTALDSKQIRTRAQFAALDPFTAYVGSELTGSMLGKVLSADDAVSLASLIEKRPEALAFLAAEGVTTVGGLRRRLHRVTQSVLASSAGGKALAGRIDVARAVVSESAFRRRGVGSLRLESPVVEIDVDMESSASGHHYLWGALPVVAGVTGEYVPFDSYVEMTDVAEAEIFVRFWTWLAEQRTIAESLGGVIRVYHWTAAELTAMRTIIRRAALPTLPTAAELEASIKAEWVDLVKVWDAHVLTGHGKGLKPVANSIGFTWPDDDAGGDFSMLQHKLAVEGTAEESANAISWLRAYNSHDVAATLAVRSWLRENFDALPSIQDWRAP
ncbi:MAG: hypothetical protein JWP74_2290 [Marmoricola sp.]|nr:hypothetical protein [Marmoricola sp.]